MFGVSNILNSSESSDKDDYFKLLNCDEKSSVEQINAEFKVLALQCHPDKNSGDDASLRMFQSLQEARDTLIDPGKRSQYEKWRRSEMSMSFKQWLALGSRCQPTMHWVKPGTQTMLEYANEEHVGNSGPSTKVSRTSDAEGGYHHKDKRLQWESESRCSVYKQFRSYQI